MGKDYRFFKIFFTLFLSVFITTMGAGIIGPLLPVYAHELGANPFQIGLIFAAFSLTRSIFVPYFGRLSDIKGKKPILMTGLLIYFFLSILYSLSNGIWQLIILRLTQGFASAMILPVAQAYVGILTPEAYEGRTMGLFNVSLYGGLSAGPIIGGIVKDHSGMRCSFLSMGILAFIGFLFCFLLLPSKEKEPKLLRKKSTIPYSLLIKNLTIMVLFLFRVCFTLCIGIMWTFLPLVASTKLGFSSTSIGILLSIHVLVSGIFQTPMGYLADRFSKKNMIITGGLLGIISMLCLAKATDFWHIAVVNAFLGLSAGISIPAVMAISVIEGRKTASMGSVMGLMAQAHSLGMFFGPILAGFLMQFVTLKWTFIISGFILALGTSLIFLLL